MRRILAGIVLAVMLTGGAAAGPYEEGVAAYERGDYATALRLWRPLAEQGDALAQYNLGVAHVEGHGVPQDHAEAAKWFRFAAEQGFAKAQYNVGLMYVEGRGVPQDHAEALKWFRLAAEQGDAGAQYNLGVMCVRGMGVQQDYVEAHMWFTLAASRYANSENRERAVQNVDRAASHMAPTQIAEAQKLAQEWKPK